MGERAKSGRSTRSTGDHVDSMQRCAQTFTKTLISAKIVSLAMHRKGKLCGAAEDHDAEHFRPPPRSNIAVVFTSPSITASAMRLPRRGPERFFLFMLVFVP